eukprot:m.79387 g.79387  ORF g.79387 m.79387 type:complete len:91 (-) comp10800_c0_seq2:707-979(-)
MLLARDDGGGGWEDKFGSIQVMATFSFDGWTPERLDSLAGKTYVIAGANVSCSPKEEFEDDAGVTFVRMGLAERDSVRNAAAKVLEMSPK